MRGIGMFRSIGCVAAMTVLVPMVLVASSDPSSAAEAKGAPIPVVIIGAISSPAFSVPEQVGGADAAAKAINASGGINGRPIEVQSCNDMGTPNLSTSCAEKAVSSGDVAVVGTLSIGGTQILPVLQSGGVADIGPDPVSPIEFTSPNSFPVQCGTLCQDEGEVQILESHGVKTVSIPYEGDAAGEAALPLYANAAKKLGVKVVSEVSIPPTATDLSTYVSEINAGKPEGIILDVEASQTALFLSGFSSVGSTAKIAASAPLVPQSVLDSLNGAANGAYLGDTMPPTYSNIKTDVDFRQDMKKYSP